MTTLLATEGLTKRYGGLVAVEALDLAVTAGEIHALIGPNGAGKTTVLNLVTRVTDPTAGRILFEGADLTRVPAHGIAARGIARTFQHMELFAGLSVLENVVIGAHVRGRAGLLSAVLDLPAARRERAARAEEAHGWLAFVGLAALAARKAGGLTAGQGRLLGLARALASRPRFLLLDELVAGLNTQETEAAAALVRRAARERGITMLVVEHDMRFVMSISDRITVLDFGRRIAVGTPAEIRRNPAVIKAYLGTASFGDASVPHARAHDARS
jgi:branched-chain amino acid transport system ATP-binding protein